MIKQKDIEKVWLDDKAIYIRTKSGNEAFEEFSKYARLKSAKQSERKNYQLNAYGIYWPDLDEDLSFDGFFKNNDSEVASLLNQHSILNISALARRMKISQPLFAAYISGAKKPSLSRLNKIKEEIKKIGAELLATK